VSPPPLPAIPLLLQLGGGLARLPVVAAVLGPGANVMVTVFDDFDQFSTKKEEETLRRFIFCINNCILCRNIKLFFNFLVLIASYSGVRE
jgi:hypothetical protein